MSRISIWEFRKHLPAVVVGSSLGALVALEAGRTALAAPLVLIAPALGLRRRWIERLPPGDPLPFIHHGEERELFIHRRFFEEMTQVEADRDPPVTPAIVIMGRQDESVPIGLVRDVWARWQASGRLREGSRFVEIPEGDHGLTAHVDRIADAILAAAALRS